MESIAGRADDADLDGVAALLEQCSHGARLPERKLAAARPEAHPRHHDAFCPRRLSIAGRLSSDARLNSLFTASE
jgi:hypothetical protein